jgi:glycosyltransferase involved in cell wall biosynthesis
MGQLRAIVVSLVSTSRSVHVIVPRGFDDDARPSGGNSYDRQLCAELIAIGWQVQIHAVPGDGFSAALVDIPTGALVLIDGLVAFAAPSTLRQHANRLQLILLMHMALADGFAWQERAESHAALLAARAVITPSSWLREVLIGQGLRPERIHVAAPGVQRAALVRGTAGGGQLLCVGVIGPHKRHDALLEALAAVADRPWHCVCAGSLDLYPAFAAQVQEQARAEGIADRVDFVGPLTDAALARAYAAADVLVHPSGSESYAMVVTEALACGLPVIANDVGGVPEALGCTPDGLLPGLLADRTPGALTVALMRWLDDAALRGELRAAAQERRTMLAGWEQTARTVASVLTQAAGQ